MTQTFGALSNPIFEDTSIRAVFSDAKILSSMIRVEVALAKVQADLGIIPSEAAQAIAEAEISVDSSEIAKGVAETGVPVPSLVRILRDQVGEPGAEWVHYGATSQDIVDTGLNLCYRTALDILEPRLSIIIDQLEALSRQHETTLFLARTRGQAATPITLGLRFAQWAHPFINAEASFERLRDSALRLQFGGASGSSSALGEDGPTVAAGLARELNLTQSPSWHTDRGPLHELADWLSGIVTASAKIGGDVMLSSRSEIREMQAGTGGGSSTMPHKANPVLAEAAQSVAPLVLGLVTALKSASPHAEERDGRYWPVEWRVMPDIFSATGAALGHVEQILSSLVVDAAAMRARIEAAPEVMAEAAVFAAAPHIGRQSAERLVKDALASDQPFQDALHLHGPSEVNWSDALDPERCIKPAAAMARQIFAARRA